MTRQDLITDIQYKGADMSGTYMLIGFVDIKDGENVVCHMDLTRRTVEEVKEMTAEEIQALAQQEAEVLMQSEECNKRIEDYLFLKNLSLY